MTQRLALTRHTKTLRYYLEENKVQKHDKRWQQKEHLDNVISLGVDDAKILAGYLSILELYQPFFIFPDIPRNRTTAKVISDEMQLDFCRRNYIQDSFLREELPLEFTPEDQRTEHNHELRSAEDIGSDAYYRLLTLCHANPDRDAIAVLNGGVNISLAYVLGLEPRGIMEHCSLYLFEVDREGFSLVQDYMTIKQMKKELRGRVV